MKILFVSAVLPYPLYSGGQVRIYNLLKLLSKKHDITLLSFIRTEDERRHVKNLSFLGNVRLVFRGRAIQPSYMVKAMGKYPLLLASYDNSRMKDLIQNQLKETAYDLVHIEPFYVYPSLPELSLPLVVAEHNIEYAVYESYAKHYSLPLLRPFLAMDSTKIKSWEQIVWKRASRIIAVSKEDAEVISGQIRKTVSVIPNGVDTGWFRFSERVFTPARPTFVFVGNFAWAPNIDAADTLLKKIWPAIISAFPKASLTIAGKRFPTTLRAHLDESISIKQNAEDIRDIFRSSDVLLAPMGISGGSKFKLLEAMASGTAVVSTPAGYSGLRTEPGKHLWSATDVKEFVTAVRTIYSDSKKRSVILSHARDLVEKEYDWSNIAKKLDDVWNSVL